MARVGTHFDRRASEKPVTLDSEGDGNFMGIVPDEDGDIHGIITDQGEFGAIAGLQLCSRSAGEKVIPSPVRLL